MFLLLLKLSFGHQYMSGERGAKSELSIIVVVAQHIMKFHSPKRCSEVPKKVLTHFSLLDAKGYMLLHEITHPDSFGCATGFSSVHYLGDGDTPAYSYHGTGDCCCKGDPVMV